MVLSRRDFLKIAAVATFSIAGGVETIDSFYPSETKTIVEWGVDPNLEEPFISTKHEWKFLADLDEQGVSYEKTVVCNIRNNSKFGEILLKTTDPKDITISLQPNKRENAFIATDSLNNLVDTSLDFNIVTSAARTFGYSKEINMLITEIILIPKSTTDPALNEIDTKNLNTYTINAIAPYREISFDGPPDKELQTFNIGWLKQKIIYGVRTKDFDDNYAYYKAITYEVDNTGNA